MTMTLTTDMRTAARKLYRVTDEDEARAVARDVGARVEHGHDFVIVRGHGVATVLAVLFDDAQTLATFETEMEQRDLLVR